MTLLLAHISQGRVRAKADGPDSLAGEYVTRAGRFVSCSEQGFGSEKVFLEWLGKRAGRTRPTLILLDRKGRGLSSEEFAAQLGGLRDSGAQTVVLAIGPADGWSQEACGRADLLVSFGAITLPHELARVVLAEQTYRALTILAGHPYHCGH